jgi:ectoine hydroxylase-related dioxygenase (phytanoyl-CoA dioxygenase family)
MPHLAHRWALDLCGCPRVLDAVECLIGADILLVDSKFFPKPAGSTTFVSWHQDGTYAGYRPEDGVVTAWIGLTDSTPENGCLRMIPGSDRLGQLGHDKTFATDNLLSRGQAIRDAIDEGAAVDVRLKAGEMSLHNLNVVHGSGANRTTARRVGIMIGYVTPRVTMSGEENYAATLVRGRDTIGRWRPAPRPGDT